MKMFSSVHRRDWDHDWTDIYVEWDISFGFRAHGQVAHLCWCGRTEITPNGHQAIGWGLDVPTMIQERLALEQQWRDEGLERFGWWAERKHVWFARSSVQTAFIAGYVAAHRRLTPHHLRYRPGHEPPTSSDVEVD